MFVIRSSKSDTAAPWFLSAVIVCNCLGASVFVAMNTSNSVEVFAFPYVDKPPFVEEDVAFVCAGGRLMVGGGLLKGTRTICLFTANDPTTQSVEYPLPVRYLLFLSYGNKLPWRFLRNPPTTGPTACQSFSSALWEHSPPPSQPVLVRRCMLVNRSVYPHIEVANQRSWLPKSHRPRTRNAGNAENQNDHEHNSHV